MTREWARILHLTSRRHAFATSNRRPLAGLSDKALTWHGIGRKWKLVQKLGPEFRINLTHPDHSLLLQAPLAADAGGAGLCKNPDGSAVFKDKADAEKLYRAEIHHRRWPLERAEIQIEKNTLLADVDVGNQHPVVLFSKSIDVVAYPLTKLKP